MKKILTLFIALILVAGIVSVAKSTNYILDDDGNTDSTSRSKSRHIVQSSDGTIVVFYKRLGAGPKFAVRKSTDSGVANSWTKLDGTSGYTVIDSTTSTLWRYEICIDDNDNIYVTYEYNNDIFFNKLTAQAGTWTTWTLGTRRTVDTTNDNGYPTITYQESTGRVWVAYGQDDTGSNAWLRAKWAVSPFTDWTLTTVATGGDRDYYYIATLVLRNDSPYIVYDDEYGTHTLDYAIWGGSWSGGTICEETTYGDFSVTLITTTVHVVYFDSEKDLFHTYSSNGTNWSAPDPVSSPEYEGYEDKQCSLTTDWDTDDEELWVYASIYYQDTSSSFSKSKIKYREWDGNSWDNYWTDIGTGEGWNYYPTTPFVSRGRIPVAWGYDENGPSGGGGYDEDIRFNFDAVTLDLTSPEAIDDLAGTCPTGNVILTWDTPGDNGASGTLPEMSGYRLDYSSVTKTWDKDDYEVWIPTNGVTPGTGVSYTVASLQGDTDWYFRIWTRDEVPNWSGLSNGCTVWVSAPSQTYNWDGGGAEGDWDDADNWDVGGSYPDDATDKAIINTGSESINTGAVLTIGELELGSDYSGTLTLGGNFTLDDSGPWDGNLTISTASATLDLIGYNLTIPGTFSNDGTLKLRGGQTLTFTNDTNSGTFEYVGNGDAVVDTYTIKNFGTNDYYNLTINSSGAADDVFQLGAELRMDGTLIVTSGVLYLRGYSLLDITGGATAVRGDIADTIRLYGDESVFWTTNDTNSGTYEYVGDGDAAGDTYSLLDFGTTDYYNLTINSTDGTTDTFRSSTTVLTTAYNFTLSSGTFTTNDGTTDRNLIVGGSVDIDGTFTANSSTITVSGNWDSYDGVFNYGTSTVDLAGIGTSTLTGSTTFYVLVSTTSEKTVQVSSDTVIDVTNHLNFENITLQSISSGATWYLNLSGTQDVHHVDVRDSNADDGNTIYARSSTDLGNNTNWVFDDSILTWDGSESTDWNTAENWNFNIVPLSTHTVIIPDGTPYDPQLTSDVIISSITIETDGQLSLNEKNITVTSDVYLHGSLICSAGEQITVGGNWSAYSGATFTASSSTVTFNASSGTKNILSSGTTFYNLVITTNTTTATYELSDELYVQNDFTVLNGTFDTNSSGNYVVTIGGNVDIDGTFNANSSTITVSGNWDSVAGTFDRGTSSTVQLAGTGTASNSWPDCFYDLVVAYSGETTTVSGTMYVYRKLTINGGNLSGSNSIYFDYDSDANPLTITAGSTITTPLVFNANVSAAGTVNVPAYDGYAALYFKNIAGYGTGTYQAQGNITCTYMRTYSAQGGTCIFDSNGYNLTVNGNLIAGDTTDNDRYGQFNFSTSTVNVTGDVTIYPSAAGSTNSVTLTSGSLTAGGNWTNNDTFTCGTSTVTFDNATSTSTLTGSTTFYVLISTATGKNVKFTSDIVIGVTNHLNFENITLRSTSSGATWYLNLSGDQDVSGVDVRDSNASGGDTIIDFDCPDIVGCYYGNNTNWDFAPPAAITDLTGLCDSDTGDVTLYWSTPGDDEWTGVLSSTSEYRIDYSTDSSRQWDKDTYEVSIPTYGVTPNTEVSHTITGLTGGSTWYFRIWTADEIPRWSGLSNGATVWVNPILSVTIEPSVRPFGEVPANQSDVLSDEFTVENTGNITQKYQLRLTGVPTGWTAKNVAGAPGWNEVKILGLFTTQSPPNTTHFNDNPPNAGDGDIVRTTNDDEATSTNFAISGEGVEVKGYNVTVGGIRYLWFRFDAPSGTSITNEQFLTVTVTAIQQ